MVRTQSADPAPHPELARRLQLGQPASAHAPNVTAWAPRAGIEKGRPSQVRPYLYVLQICPRRIAMTDAKIAKQSPI